IDLEARVMAAIEAKASKKIDAEALGEEKSPAPNDDDAPESREQPLVAHAKEAKTTSVVRSMASYVNKRRKSFGAGLALAAAVAIGVIALRAKNTGNPVEVASSPWAGTVDAVVGTDGGLMIVDDKGGPTKALSKGDHLSAGAHVRTDVRTRARIA